MAEKPPITPESNQETKNTPPASADEFVSGIRKERQRLEDEITSTQDRDTSHNLEGYSELYERQKRRDLHDLEGKLLDLDQIWYDAGGAEVDALEAELKDPRNRGNKDALTDRLDRAKEAAYQNYLEETGQVQPEGDATGAKKEQEGAPALPAGTEQDEQAQPKPEQSPNPEAPGRAWTYEIPEELVQELESATNKYAELTARDRNTTLTRFGLSQKSMVGRLLRKVPGVKNMIDAYNDRRDQDTQDARRDYQEKVTQTAATVMAQLEAQYTAAFAQIENASLGDDDKQAAKEALDASFENTSNKLTLVLHTGAELGLENKILEHRSEASKDTNRFVNWWVNQAGVGGKIKKGLVVAGAGVGAGVVGGLVASGVVAGMATVAAGGAVGAGIANHVTKRRANAALKRYDGKTVAEVQRQVDLERKTDLLNQNNDEEWASVEDMTYITEARTNDEVLSNRRRMKAATSIGKIAAGAGFGAVWGLKNMASPEQLETIKATPDAPKGPNDPSVFSEVPGSTEPAAPVTSPEVLGQDFVVEPGNGYTHELIDFAETNGKNLTIDQSYQLHLDLMREFGSEYMSIDPQSVASTYLDHGDVRLANPGSARWVDGVTTFAQNWMNTRGL